MNEIWKDVSGFEGIYKVSNKSRIMSLPRKSVPNKVILKQVVSTNGYLVVNLSGIVCYSHRIIAKEFIPNPENKPQVNHKNGIKNDNRLYNLEWVTHQENIQHGHDLGLWKYADSKGENHNSCKLTDQDVLNIRSLYKSGSFTHKEIAKAYDIGRRQIGKIINRKAWTHI